MKELVENLIADFNHDNLVVLFRNKTRSFKPINEELSGFNDDLFSECTLLGSFKTTDDELEMLIFTAKTNNDLTERSGKKRQYELGKRVLKEQLRYSGGFFVFYDSNGAFRFSFIYDIPLPNGKVSFSNFRRYTYFVSREQTNKTFIRQISEAEFTSLSKIIEAFSIEPVTKQFYNEIQNWYFWALQKVRFPEDAENQPNGREINLIRFITRIIFIYFMKEKKWISNNLFQQNELREILINLNPEDSTYYKAILQNLFFAVLNTPIQERKFRREDTYKGRNDDYMNHTYFRYHKLFKNENDIIEIFQNIPFLNGGLFECLDKRKDDPDNNTGKEIRIDGFSDVESKQPIFPNELFFADEQEFILQNEVGNDKKNTKVNVRGIINILNSYNFTTEENSLSDTEIALDPELLGKVFENLLAAYNPETATTARKATGSYYTPREIVDFMVNESLKVYFQSSYVREFGNQSLRDFENKLETLFSLEDDENPYDKGITQFLIEKIHKVKILDPAVGSGAFLMGCLHKLVFLLSKLDPHNNSWKNEQLRTVEMITDPDLRQKVKNKIEESFKKNELDYGRKLYLIQNCIYGVDIQPIAVQITKLRFFISLLVDEKINNTSPEENFGIDPLPNLETKLIAANTLINLPVEPYTCPRMNEIIELEKKIFELRKNHFSTSSSDDKAKIQKQDFEYRKKLIQIIEMYVKENQDKLIELQNELLKYPPKIETVSKQTLLGNESVKVDVNKEKREYIQKKINETKKYVEADKLLTQKFIKIASFNIYNSNFPTDWFDPEWMFGVTDGFDIVIGNPPYIQLQKAANPEQKYADFYKDQEYETFDRMGDIYCLFYERGIQLLKPDGILCYITSNKWMRAGYGEKLRDFFTKYNPLQLVDLGPGVFENATVDTNILIIRKTSNQNHLKAVTLQKEDKEDISNALNEKGVLLTKLTKDAWFIGSDAEQRLKEKIESIGKPLKDWDVNIYYGIKTGLNEAFIITTEKRNEILANCQDEAERRRTETIIKPILRGRDIKRYYYEWAGLWVIVIPAGWTNENRNNEKPDDFIQRSLHSLMQHLKQFEAKAIKRDDQGDYWWELRHCAYYSEFEKEKVVYIEIMTDNPEEGYDFPCYSYDENKCIVLNTAYILIGERIKYLLGLLNSKFGKFYIKQNVTQLQKRQFRMLAQYIREIFIPPITPSNEPIVKQIEALIDNILAAKKQNPQTDTGEWENEIDRLVYRLYELTEEEVKIIEGGR